MWRRGQLHFVPQLLVLVMKPLLWQPLMRACGGRGATDATANSALLPWRVWGQMQLPRLPFSTGDHTDLKENVLFCSVEAFYANRRSWPYGVPLFQLV